MNEWAMLCYMTLYAVISHYSVLSHAEKIFTMHALCPLSMVEMNGKPPLTGAEGRALSVFQYPIMLISANAQKSVTNIDGTPCNISLLRISFDSGK